MTLKEEFSKKEAAFLIRIAAKAPLRNLEEAGVLTAILQRLAKHFDLDVPTRPDQQPE